MSSLVRAARPVLSQMFEVSRAWLRGENPNHMKHAMPRRIRE